MGGGVHNGPHFLVMGPLPRLVNGLPQLQQGKRPRTEVSSGSQSSLQVKAALTIATQATFELLYK